MFLLAGARILGRHCCAAAVLCDTVYVCMGFVTDRRMHMHGQEEVALVVRKSSMAEMKKISISFEYELPLNPNFQGHKVGTSTTVGSGVYIYCRACGYSSILVVVANDFQIMRSGAMTRKGGVGGGKEIFTDEQQVGERVIIGWSVARSMASDLWWCAAHTSTHTYVRTHVHTSQRPPYFIYLMVDFCLNTVVLHVPCVVGLKDSIMDAVFTWMHTYMHVVCV